VIDCSRSHQVIQVASLTLQPIAFEQDGAPEEAEEGSGIHGAEGQEHKRNVSHEHQFKEHC